MRILANGGRDPRSNTIFPQRSISSLEIPSTKIQIQDMINTPSSIPLSVGQKPSILTAKTDQDVLQESPIAPPKLSAPWICIKKNRDHHLLLLATLCA